MSFLFIAQPKTGTTLVTWICHLLRTNASDNFGFDCLYEVAPWPTLSWDIGGRDAPSWRALVQPVSIKCVFLTRLFVDAGMDPNVQGNAFAPRVFKSHLRMASIYPSCKYVVTVRDPAATTLSFYNFFLAKKVPFLVDGPDDGCPKVDVSTFLMDMPFVQGNSTRGSIWDYYAEYHALLECPSVLILVYEDFVSDLRAQVRRLHKFIDTPSGESGHDDNRDNKGLIDRVAAMATKEYMARHNAKFDEPYERAKALGRAADVAQMAPGNKVALQRHQQTLDARAEAFLGERWERQMRPLGYKNYAAFAAAARERNNRLFGRG